MDSSIAFSSEWQGTIFKQWGKVLEFNPTEKLRYTLFVPRPGLLDIPENYFEMTYKLAVEGEYTLLEIIQEDNRQYVVQENEQRGHNPVLLMLKHLAESERLA